VERVQRLTSKKPEWSLPALKLVKLALIASLSKRWLPVPVSVLLAIILSCDPDPDVSAQAIFKMNGARSIFPEIDLNPYPVLELLLVICLPGSVNSAHFPVAAEETHHEKWLKPLLGTRTAIRDEIKCAILRWIMKEMQHHLPVAMQLTVQLVFLEIAGLPNSTAAAQANVSSSTTSGASAAIEDLYFKFISGSTAVPGAGNQDAVIYSTRGGESSAKYRGIAMDLAASLCDQQNVVSASGGAIENVSTRSASATTGSGNGAADPATVSTAPPGAADADASHMGPSTTTSASSQSADANITLPSSPNTAVAQEMMTSRSAPTITQTMLSQPPLFASAAPLLLHASLKALQPFSSQLSAQASSSVDSVR
jgi:hypothetical protein